MPLGRRNSPGRSPLPPTLRRRSPVSASNTTNEWLDLAVATSQVWPSSVGQVRSEEHTSELQSLMRISYAVFCLKKKNKSLTSHVTYFTCTISKYSLRVTISLPIHFIYS